MAQKAEEYGSHDKTFEAPADGKIRIVRSDGTVVMEHDVEKGDIWRACQAKDAPIKDWVKLAVTRARASGWPAVFWLDENRAHDVQMIEKVKKYLPEFDTTGLDISTMAPQAACRHSLVRAKAGENTISVTGNVLRDYNTDLFPILELGTSAKMLSIVPMLAGGGMYETGAGGSAPKHVEQFEKEGHLRWDSLGEFLALEASLDDIATKTRSGRVRALQAALQKACENFLSSNKSPSRKKNEISNQGSHFYLALFWAEEMAKTDIPDLKAVFEPVAKLMRENEEKIAKELIDCQGEKVELGGYFLVNPELAAAAMRPSETLNGIIALLMRRPRCNSRSA
jgi:isocitrate dehydrogenase